MEPAEKAKDLLIKFGWNESGDTQFDRVLFSVALQHALVAVDEILEYTKQKSMPMGEEFGGAPTYDYDEYWLEVKEEIMLILSKQDYKISSDGGVY